MDTEIKTLLDTINANVVQLSRLISILISELNLSDYGVEESDEDDPEEPSRVTDPLFNLPEHMRGYIG